MSKKTAPPKASKKPQPEAPAKTPKFEAELIAEAIQAAVAQATAPKEKREIPKGTCDPDSIELFHQKGDGTYWLREEENGFVEYVKYKPSRLADHFIALGMTKALYRLGLREIDWPIYKADRKNRVDYCGPLAGHRAGKYIDKGGRVFLVTQEAQGVWDAPPKDAPAPVFLTNFTQELLQAPGEWEHAMHWCAKALSSMQRGDFRPGPALGLAGEAECGKSLFQYIITQLLGGRMAKPWKYMIGEEKHNYDMITAEHWMIGDPPATTDTRARRFFGNMIKDCCYEEEFRIRAMAKDALSAPLFRRVTITVNDEAENLMVFPPMDSSLRDKISLLKCSRVTEALKEFDTAERQLAIALDSAGREIDPGDQDRGAVKKRIDLEMPAFRALLLNHFTNVPNAFDRARIGTDPTMRTRRTGLCAYQNPELMETLTSLSPEVRLLEMINQVMFDASSPDVVVQSKWEGRAVDVEKRLRESELSIHADRLLSRFDNACGTYLGRAMKLYPERISREVRHGGVPFWIIQKPKAENIA